MDEALKGAIQAVCDRRYRESEGPATLRVSLIRALVADRLDRAVTRNVVEVAADELVEEGRLAFLRDHGRDGRRYGSAAMPRATIDLLREAGLEDE